MNYVIADHFFSVHCSSSEIADSANEFLLGLRAAHSKKQDFSSHANLLLRTRQAEIPSDVTCCFRSREAGVEISYFSAPAAYVVGLGNSVVSAQTGPEVTVCLAPDLNCRSFLFQRILTHGFTAAMRRIGVFELHCAAVVEPASSRTVLIVGPSGSGKSTLAFQLVTQGWHYSTDDVVLLTNSAAGVEAHGLRKYFALTSETIESANLGTINRSSLELTGIDNKFSLLPERYFRTKQLQKCTPNLLVFMSLSGQTVSAAAPLTQGEAMQRLLGISPWVGMDLPTAPACVNVLGALARQSRAFDLDVGRELLGNEQYTADLLRSMLNETHD